MTDRLDDIIFNSKYGELNWEPWDDNDDGTVKVYFYYQGGDGFFADVDLKAGTVTPREGEDPTRPYKAFRSAMRGIKPAS